MNTRKKNKSAHPVIPDMSSSQLLAAGLHRTSGTRSPSTKKLTKDQQIAALREEIRLRDAQEAMLIVRTITP